MKKEEAERLHRYLIDRWMQEENPSKNDVGTAKLLSFHDYLTFARNIRPDCMDFRCRGGADHRARMWFDSQTGQNWTR